MVKDYTFYRIVNRNGDINMSYVGSTSDMNQRKRAHKSDCNNINKKSFNFKLYKTMREFGGFDEFQFIELGYKEGITKNEACIIEEQHRVNLRANLNSCRCNLTHEDRKCDQKNHYQLNKDKISKSKKLYYLKNKDKIKEYNINRYYELKEIRLKEEQEAYEASEIFN